MARCDAADVAESVKIADSVEEGNTNRIQNLSDAAVAD